MDVDFTSAQKLILLANPLRKFDRHAIKNAVQYVPQSETL
jgi:hypothetical protein